MALIILLSVAIATFLLGILAGILMTLASDPK